jgi:putative ABC transport system ATP-binding protein
MMNTVELESVRFGWGHRPDTLHIPGFSLGAGERIFLHGASGSGKSTLLSLIAGVLQPRSGNIRVMGETVSSLSPARRDRLRGERIGVIFQMFNLVPYLSVLENTVLPCQFSRNRRQKAETAGGVDSEARRLLGRLGLSDPSLVSRSVRELSVGQQQRVAAARALIGGPSLILADEPTSALDHEAREAFIRLLMEECARSGAALLFVSHDPGLAPLFDRQADIASLNRAGREI